MKKEKVLINYIVKVEDYSVKRKNLITKGHLFLQSYLHKMQEMETS